MNKWICRRVDFNNDKEMMFIAETDILIPAKFDSEFPTDEKMIADRLKHFREKFNEADFFDVAVSESNEIVGFHVIKKHSHFNNKDVGNIYTLWVSKDFRKQGVAKELKRRGEDWAKKSNLDHLYTWVHSDNSKMLSLNKKMGFEIVNHKMIKKMS
jgi:RimJ/RimL family protein N-acetyltransferase